MTEVFSVITSLLDRVPGFARFLALVVVVYLVSRILSGLCFGIAEFFGSFRGHKLDKYAKPLGKFFWFLARTFMHIGYGIPKRYTEAVILDHDKRKAGEPPCQPKK